jgi:hypothetical protein
MLPAAETGLEGFEDHLLTHRMAQRTNAAAWRRPHRGLIQGYDDFYLARIGSRVVSVNQASRATRDNRPFSARLWMGMSSLSW